MKLTRYLYISDEVSYTLVSRMLNKNTNFKEIIYWVNELFCSGLIKDLKEVAYYYYYNFCAINYPKYEKKINNLLKKNDLKNILNAFYILYNSKVNFKVFNHYSSKPKNITKIYLVKKMKFIKDLNIDQKYYKFVASVHKKNYVNILYYLNNSIFDIYELYTIIKMYYIKVKSYKLIDIDLKKIKYKNKKHIIIALLLYLEEDMDNIEKRRIFKKFKFDEWKSWIDNLKTPESNNYKTLKEKIKYPIDSNIGCFELDRFKHENIIDLIRDMYKWPYYCKDTKIWRDRLNKYNTIMNYKGKSMIYFKKSDEEDEFYELYDFEFDEQSKEIQSSIIPYIEKNNFESWKDSVLKN